MNLPFSVQEIVSWVEIAQSQSWMAWAFYAAFILAVLALPVTLFPIIGGVLFNFWVALPLNMAAILAGAWISFTISRRLGRNAIEPFIRGRLKAVNEISRSHGFKTVFFLRWVGLPPFTVANYALGLSKVKLRDFLLGTALGILPWLTIVTYMANSIWDSFLMAGRDGYQTALIQAVAPLSGMSLAAAGFVLTAYFIKARRSGYSNL